MRSKKIIGFIGWIVLSSLASFSGANFVPGEWYEMLQKPLWAPPNWVPPLVWPILYVLMGIAAWFVWKRRPVTVKKPALMWFLLQLILNAMWPWLFFGKHFIGTALAEILLLWIAILFTIFLFWHEDRRAGILIIPYILWVSYASALTFAVWQLN
ncbi:MAG TPA: TspO/MBR family protein [Fodinibius sp.]|nr:TspO/MBR family protein [Fodinibius sp.]